MLLANIVPCERCAALPPGDDVVQRSRAMTLLSRRRVLFGAATLAFAQLLPALGRSASGGELDASTRAYDGLLSRYVILGDDGVARVRYAAWAKNSADRDQLDAFIVEQARLHPSSMDAPAAFAFWTNLYNALTLRVVLEAYPVASIKDIKSTGTGLDLKAWSGPWRTKLVTIEDTPMSLDDIEHETMRPTFRDPRIHYAVNCASIGCPNLMGRAWRASTLEVDLDAAARAYVNHPRGASLDKKGSLRVSSLYKWYREDFGSSDAGVIEHLRRYAVEPLSGRLQGVSRIVGNSYDWSLNDA
jgi:hypothetical protein